MKCVKYTVFIINLVIWAAGLALLAMALFLRLYDTSENFSVLKDEDGQSVTQDFHLALYILIGASGLMTMVGFLGCCGASQESQCMLSSYFFFVFIIVLAEVGGVVYYIVQREKIDASMSAGFKNGVSILSKKEENDIQATAMKSMQQTFRCCGEAGPGDYGSSTVPASCCEGKDTSCSQTNKGLYKTGCTAAVQTWLETHLYITMGIIIGIVCLQALGLILSMVLCCRIRQAKSFYV